MKQSKEQLVNFPQSPKGWDKIISSVGNPLGYAVFASLLALVILGIGAVATKDLYWKKILIVSSLSIIGFSIIYVFVIAILRPEALKGERLKLKNQENNDEDERTEGNVLNTEKTTLLCETTGLISVGFFESYNKNFEQLIKNSTTITSMFIHSRRWRENNNQLLDKFLLNDQNRIQVFLPDLDNKLLINLIKLHFDDGDHLEFFIRDAYRYYSSLKRKFTERVDIRKFDLYPTYSFYIFDDVAIIAMYPTTTKKRSVPTLEINKKNDYWKFLNDDLNMLLDTSTPLSYEKAMHYANT